MQLTCVAAPSPRLTLVAKLPEILADCCRQSLVRLTVVAYTPFRLTSVACAPFYSSVIWSSAPDFYIDCYGQKRDKSTGRVRFDCQVDDRPTRVTDAFAIAELNTLDVVVPGLPKAPEGIDDNGHPFPRNYFITSPNVGDLPDLAYDSRFVYVRDNGRFGTADFTLFPQWYFIGTDYLPYIRRKPEIPLNEHPFGDIWYNLTFSDFVYERESNNIGRIKPTLAERFRKIGTELRKKAEVLFVGNEYSSLELANLRHCVEGMRFAVVILECCPQSYPLTLLSVTGFQRYYLEVLACYEYLTIYKNKPISETPEVDKTLMGTVTFSVDVAQYMYWKGVPVWLVRSPHEFSVDTVVYLATWVEVPPDAYRSPMADSLPVFKGEASAIRNRACQAIKAGNIRHGHPAYAVMPGDFNLLNCIRVSSQQIYSDPFGAPTPENLARLAAVTVPPSRVSGPTPSSSSASSATLSSSASATRSSSASASSTPRSLPGPLSASSSSPAPSMRHVAPNHLPSSSTTSISLDVMPAPPNFDLLNTYRSIEEKKFSPPKFNDLSIAIPAWEEALQSVDFNWKRIKSHPNSELLRGYAFLDPHILLNKDITQERPKANLLGWCAIRGIWFARVSNYTKDSLYALPQDWRTFLIADVGEALQLRATEYRPSAREQKSMKKRKLNSLVDDLFMIDISGMTSSTTIWWRYHILAKIGQRSVSNITLSSQIFYEVIWDLFECNFRIELLSLDRSIYPRDGLGEIWSSRRDTMVANCFPGGTFLNINFPVNDEGLGAANWEERLVFVEAFRILLSSWPGAEQKGLQALPELSKPSSVLPGSRKCEVEAVELIAYPFFCQTFFDYFGRAPSIPFFRPPQGSE